MGEELEILLRNDLFGKKPSIAKLFLCFSKINLCLVRNDWSYLCHRLPVFGVTTPKN